MLKPNRIHTSTKNLKPCVGVFGVTLSAPMVYDEVDGVWKSMCVYDDDREVFRGMLD